MYSRAHHPQLFAFVIKDLMALTAVSLSVLVSPCVATEGTARCKATYQHASVTMDSMDVRASAVCRNLQDLNATNASQTTLAGQSDATCIVSMATLQVKKKISARVTMILTEVTGMAPPATVVCSVGDYRLVRLAMVHTLERDAISIVSLRMLNTVTNSTGTGVNSQLSQSSTVFTALLKAKCSPGLDITTETLTMCT